MFHIYICTKVNLKKWLTKVSATQGHYFAPHQDGENRNGNGRSLFSALLTLRKHQYPTLIHSWASLILLVDVEQRLCCDQCMSWSFRCYRYLSDSTDGCGGTTRFVAPQCPEASSEVASSMLYRLQWLPTMWVSYVIRRLRVISRRMTNVAR